jgi:hypothetical protein
MKTRLETVLQVGTVIGVPQSPCVLAHASYPTRNHIFFGGDEMWGAHLTSLHDPSPRPPALLCLCLHTSTQPNPK